MSAVRRFRRGGTGVLAGATLFAAVAVFATPASASTEPADASVVTTTVTQELAAGCTANLTAGGYLYLLPTLNLIGFTVSATMSVSCSSAMQAIAVEVTLTPVGPPGTGFQPVGTGTCTNCSSRSASASDGGIYLSTPCWVVTGTAVTAVDVPPVQVAVPKLLCLL